MYFKQLCRLLRPGLLATALTAVLSGCATTNFQSAQPFTGKAAPTSLYIYSFLDLRESMIGPKFLAEVRDQLGQALESRGLRQKQLWFNESPQRTEYSLETKTAGGPRSSTRVPVGEVIEATRAQEVAFGASHRLVIFPIEVSRMNATHSVRSRWDITDARTNEQNWSGISNYVYQNWASMDENFQERAKAFVAAVIEGMEKAGIFRR